MVQSTKDMKPNEIEKKVAETLKSIKDKNIGGGRVISFEYKGLFRVSIKSGRFILNPSDICTFVLLSVLSSLCQSVRQFVSPSFSPAISQSVKCQSISQSVSRSVNQSANKPIS